MKVSQVSLPLISKVTFKGRAEDSYFSRMAKDMFADEKPDVFIRQTEETNICENSIGDLRTDFIRTLKHLGIPEKKAQNEYFVLLNAYDVDRSYHNLDHIENMQKNLNTYLDLHHERLKEPAIFKLAIYYHDFVNGKPNDVEDSAQTACELLMTSSKKDINKKADLLKRLIIATSHTKDLANASYEEKLISDLDLAVLASEPDEYADYSSKVREEYADYSDEDYAKGRSKVLEDLLDKEQIFHTPFFSLNYESRARDNIKQELDNLKENNNL